MSRKMNSYDTAISVFAVVVVVIGAGVRPRRRSTPRDFLSQLRLEDVGCINVNLGDEIMFGSIFPPLFREFLASLSSPKKRS